MSMLSRVKHDVALRNLTIYAQWLGIATTFAAIYVEVSENHLYSLKGWEQLSGWQVLAKIWVLITLPLYSLVLEMPWLFKHIPICHYFFVPWWMALGSRWRDRIASAWARVGAYLAFSIACSLWVGRMRYHWNSAAQSQLPIFRFNVAVFMALLTASLYLLACVCRHRYVFGRTLGGSGIEPMDLTLPGSEPRYPAISQEGAIRLT